jgi:PKD repeat protein
MSTKRWLAVGLVAAGLVTACDKRPGDPGNEAPDARFSSTCAALQCAFNDTSTDDVRVASWSWTFGDDGSSSDQDPTHDYAVAGPYTVGLTVTDEEGESSTITRQVVATNPVVTSLSCVDGSAPGGYVECTLRLEQEAGFKVVLNSHDCEAHGNAFRVTAPVQQTLTTDGCYDQVGKQLTSAGAFPAGTEISAEVVAPMLQFPPKLRVSGSYPEWQLTYEDGVDQDFNDLVMTLTALPTGN